MNRCSDCRFEQDGSKNKYHSTVCTFYRQNEVDKVSRLMPRKGLCNGCTQLIAGSQHCKGMEMGCACTCREPEFIRPGDRVSWQYTHSLNSTSQVERVKKGEYIGRVRHQSRYWRGPKAVQMCFVHFDGNTHMSKVPLYSIKKIK